MTLEYHEKECYLEDLVVRFRITDADEFRRRLDIANGGRSPDDGDKGDKKRAAKRSVIDTEAMKEHEGVRGGFARHKYGRSVINIYSIREPLPNAMWISS